MEDHKKLRLIQLKRVLLQQASLSLESFCRVMNPDLMRLSHDPTASLFDCQPHHRLIIERLEEIAHFSGRSGRSLDREENKNSSGRSGHPGSDSARDKQYLDREENKNSSGRSGHPGSDSAESRRGSKPKNLIITMPPRHGKSFLAVEHFIPWFVGLNPNLNAIICSYSDDLAVDKFGAAILTTLTSPLYKDIFPQVSLSASAQSKNNITTSLGGELVFSGLNGGITGKGANLLLLDDPHKNREQAQSKLYRDKVWQSFVDDFASRGNTGDTPIIVIMTRWHEDDLVGRLTDPNNPHYNARNAEKWDILRLPALAEADDPLGRDEGDALWPARFSKQDLIEKRDQNPHGFASLYQGNPVPDGGHFFDVDQLRYYDGPPPEGLIYYAALDAAMTEGKRSDYSALFMGGFDPQGQFWVHPAGLLEKMRNTRLAPAAALKLSQFAEQHTLLALYMEKGPATAAVDPLLQEELQRLGVYLTHNRIAANKNKQARAATLKALIEQGRVFLPRFAPWKAAAIEQLQRFGRGGHDDAVDALALITSELNRQIRRQMVPVPPKKADPDGMTIAQMIKQTRQKAKRRRRFAG